MAASSLTTAQISRSIKSGRQQKKSTRNVLMTPYQLVWPIIGQKLQSEIRKKLKSVFSQLDLKKEKWARKRNTSTDVTKTEGQSSNNRKLRAQLKMGVNSVTRSLEGNGLRLVLVDQSAEPPMLTKHLLTLAAVRRCNILRVPALTDDIAPLLGITSLTALGFKKNTEEDCADFDELVEFIGSRCPEIDIPWLLKQSENSSRDEDDSLSKKANVSEHERLLTPGGPKAPDVKAKETEPPIDFSSIYIKKSESELINGKVDKGGFGTSGFVSFGQQSSDEEEVKEKKHKRAGSKRKHSNKYVSPSIGKMQGNKNRPSVNAKKKRTS